MMLWQVNKGRKKTLSTWSPHIRIGGRHQVFIPAHDEGITYFRHAVGKSVLYAPLVVDCTLYLTPYIPTVLGMPSLNGVYVSIYTTKGH